MGKDNDPALNNPGDVASGEASPKGIYLSRRDFIKAAALATGAAILAACAPQGASSPSTESIPALVNPEADASPLAVETPIVVPTDKPAELQLAMPGLPAEYLGAEISGAGSEEAIKAGGGKIEVPLAAVADENELGINTTAIRRDYMLVPLVAGVDVLGVVKNNKIQLPHLPSISARQTGEALSYDAGQSTENMYVFTGVSGHQEFVPSSVSFGDNERVAAVYSSHPSDTGTLYYVWMDAGTSRITRYTPAVLSQDEVQKGGSGWEPKPGVFANKPVEGDRWNVDGKQALSQLVEEANAENQQVFGKVEFGPSTHDGNQQVEQYVVPIDGKEVRVDMEDVRWFPGGYVMLLGGTESKPQYMWDGRTWSTVKESTAVGDGVYFESAKKIFIMAAGEVVEMPMGLPNKTENGIEYPSVDGRNFVWNEGQWVEVKPFDYQEWWRAEDDRLAKKYGFASWDELVKVGVDGKVVKKHPGEIGGWRSQDPLVYDAMQEWGWVLDVASIPVTTDYYKNLGIKKAVVMEVAFPSSQAMTPILTGFEMNDGAYVATMPLEVGPDQADWSQDKKLTSVAELQRYIGGVWGIKSVRSLNFKADGKTPDQIISEWDVTTYDTHIMRFRDIMTPEASLLFKKSLVNPNGYADTKTGYYSALDQNVLADTPNGTVYAHLSEYLKYASEADSWILGEVICSQENGGGLMFR